MNGLRDFRQVLSTREGFYVTPVLRDGRRAKALYDLTFRTITIRGATMSAGEIALWSRLLLGSKAVRVEGAR